MRAAGIAAAVFLLGGVGTLGSGGAGGHNRQAGTVSTTTSSASSVFGLYTGPVNVSAAEAVQTASDGQVGYAMDFTDPNTWAGISNPDWFTAQWAGSGFKMIWGVSILPNEGDYTLQQGAAGDFNQYFVELAQHFVADGFGDSIIRLGWEFNGDWFKWAAASDPQAFITYWQNIVTAMRSVPGADFQFEWNPDMGTQSIAPDQCYPGNQYVNIIGLDVYDYQYPSMPNNATEWSTILNQPYGLDWLASFAAEHGKPIALPEWGLRNDGTPMSSGDDPTFINEMMNWISENNVVNAVYFDGGTGSFSVNPNSYQALLEDLAAGEADKTTAATSSTSTTTTPTSTTTTPTSTTTTTTPTTTSTTPTSTSTTSTTTTPTNTSTTTAPITTGGGSAGSSGAGSPTGASGSGGGTPTTPPPVAYPSARPDQAPSFTSPGSATFVVGHPSSFVVAAVGVPDQVTYRIYRAPGWLSIDPSTGKLTGTPPANAPQLVRVTVEAENAVGSSTQTLPITVEGTPAVLGWGLLGWTAGQHRVVIWRIAGPWGGSLQAIGTLPKGLAWHVAGGRLVVWGDPWTPGRAALRVVATNRFGSRALRVRLVIFR